MCSYGPLVGKWIPTFTLETLTVWAIKTAAGAEVVVGAGDRTGVGRKCHPYPLQGGGILKDFTAPCPPPPPVYCGGALKDVTTLPSADVAHHNLIIMYML